MKHFTLLSALALSLPLHAADMSNWSDKTVCRLAKSQPGNNEYLTEAQNRALSCATTTNNSTTSNVKKGRYQNLSSLIAFTPDLKIVKNTKSFEEELLNYKKYASGFGFSGEFGEALSHCTEILKNWTTSLHHYTENQDQIDKSNSLLAKDVRDAYRLADLGSCLEETGRKAYRTNNRDEIAGIMLYWAKNNSVKVPSSYTRNHGMYEYSIYQEVQAISVFASYFAVFKDHLGLSQDDQDTIEDYFKSKLKKYNPAYMTKGKVCDGRSLKKTIKNLEKGNVSSDSCGSSMWKAISAQLLMGLSFNDEKLFKQGLNNLDKQLHFFDQDGIFVTWALKGPNAFHYSSNLPAFLSTYTEILNLVDYDFLNHKLPNSLTVKDVFDKQFEIFNDPQELWLYAKRNSYRGVDSSQFKAMSTEEHHRDVDTNIHSIVRNSARYVDDHRPDLHEYRRYGFTYPYYDNDIAAPVFYKGIHTFSVLDPYMLYLANNTKSGICEKVKMKDASCN